MNTQFLHEVCTAATRLASQAQLLLSECSDADHRPICEPEKAREEFIRAAIRLISLLDGTKPIQKLIDNPPKPG